MESNGEPDRVHLSNTTATILQRHGFAVTSRGEMNIKGKGLMETFWLDGAPQSNEFCTEAAVQNILIHLKRLLSDTPTGGSEAAESLGSPPSPSRARSVMIHQLGRQFSKQFSSSGNGAESPFLSVRKSLSRAAAVMTSVDASANASPGPKNPKVAAGGSGSFSADSHMHTVRRSMVRSTVLSDAQNVRMLLVTFNQPNLKAFEVALRQGQSTWTIDVAVTGEKGIEKCKACKYLYDVVLLDNSSSLGSSGGSSSKGLLLAQEVVALIRGYEATSRKLAACPAIVIGSCAAGATAEQCKSLFDAGIDEVWQSPLPQDLSQVTATLLELWRNRSVGGRRVISWK
jgi:hypothetical protein